MWALGFDDGEVKVIPIPLSDGEVWKKQIGGPLEMFVDSSIEPRNSSGPARGYKLPIADCRLLTADCLLLPSGAAYQNPPHQLGNRLVLDGDQREHMTASVGTRRTSTHRYDGCARTNTRIRFIPTHGGNHNAIA